MKKYLFPFLAIAIGLYPVIYLAKGNQFGILQLKADLWAEWTYQTGFYAHIVFGGIAMLLGWGQFMRNWRLKYPAWHRNLGKGYVAAVMPASVAGIYQTVAWLCWVPNMVFAWWVTSRQQTGIKSSPQPSKTNPGHPPE